MSQALKEVGEVLGEARERSGIKLENLAETLKIRQRYLLAIEQGEMTELPESAYIIGYLRSYAEALGLDGNAVVARFKEENDNTRREETSLPEVHKKEMRPLPLMIVVSLVAAVALYAYWYHGSNEIHAKLGAAIPPKVEKETAVPKIPEVKAVEAPALPEDTSVAAPVEKEESGSTPQIMVHVSDITKAAGPEAKIILLAKNTTAIQVLTKDNGFLLEKKLHPGESYSIPAREDLVIRSSNAETIEVYTQSNTKKALLGLLSSFVPPAISNEVPPLKQ